MVWIATTQDGKKHEVSNDVIGLFVMKNKVIECQLKK